MRIIKRGGERNMATTTMTLERVNQVKSVALKRVFMEQLELQKSGGDHNVTNFDAYTKGPSYTKHGNCLCVLGGV